MKNKGIEWIVKYMILQCWQRIRLRFSNTNTRIYPANIRIAKTTYPIEGYNRLSSEELYKLQSSHYQELGIVPSSLAKLNQ